MAVNTGANTPSINTPEPAGMETSDQKDELRDDDREVPTNPKTSGAPVEGPDDSRSHVANRNTEGPRQAGMTPRPTDRPIG